MKIYEIYANDELWDETSCPFGTEVLNREAYQPLEMSELDIYKLCEQLSAANIKFTDSKDKLHIDMQWEDEDYNSEYEMWTILYAYKGHIYSIKMAVDLHLCYGYTMTREPQFNKKLQEGS